MLLQQLFLQLLNERLMGAEGTRMDEDFLKMEKVQLCRRHFKSKSRDKLTDFLSVCVCVCVCVCQSVAVIHALLVELLSKTTEFLQPNPGTENNDCHKRTTAAFTDRWVTERTAVRLLDWAEWVSLWWREVIVVLMKETQSIIELVFVLMLNVKCLFQWFCYWRLD